MTNKSAGGEIAIKKEGEKFDKAIDALTGSAQKLKKLFKKHPAGPDDDRGRGEAAEELVDEVLAAIKQINRSPILMSLYTRSPMYRQALNKYNAPELMSQLMATLHKFDLGEAVDELKKKRIPQLVNDAWRDRAKSASLESEWFSAAYLKETENG